MYMGVVFLDGEVKEKRRERVEWEKEKRRGFENRLNGGFSRVQTYKRRNGVGPNLDSDLLALPAYTITEPAHAGYI